MKSKRCTTHYAQANWLCAALFAFCTGFFSMVHAQQWSFPITVAEFKQANIQLNLTTAKLTQSTEIKSNVLASRVTIGKKDASFIKVYFDYFNLPDDAYVTVSNPAGTEVYRYGARSDDRDGYTVDANFDEDGHRRFSSLSITGSAAVITLVIQDPDEWEADEHGVIVKRFSQGYPEHIIEELMYKQLWEKSGGVSTRSTCGTLQRKDAVCFKDSHPDEFNRSGPVVRLLIAGSSLCTGWRVSDNNRMFTNEHCVTTQSELTSTENWFGFENTTCGGSTRTVPIKVTGKDMLAQNFDLDYTLYTINNFALIQSFGNLGLDPRVPTAQEEIYIPQHGRGNPKELAIESDQNAGNVCRVDSPTTNGRGTNTDVGYLCDTIGGSSGSPVLARGTHKVIALHHLGGCENRGAQMAQIWPQVSSHFPGGIPDGDLAALRAKFSHTKNRLTVTFTDESTANASTITAWSWNFGDGNTSTVQSPTHTYGADGTYEVTLTVTDDANQTDTIQDTVSVSFNEPVVLTEEGFETGLGDWANVSSGDTHDWTRDSGGTPSVNTGPASGANGSGWYMYLETSRGSANSAGNTAILEGPSIAAAINRSLSFRFHMYGSNIGTLNVDVFANGSWTNGVRTLSGQQQTANTDAYKLAEVDLSTFNGPIKLRFRAVAAGSYRGDIAIDDIKVRGITN